MLAGVREAWDEATHDRLAAVLEPVEAELVDRLVPSEGERWLDVASFGLFLMVSFAAVYLNHHYVLDVLLGVLYTLVAWGVDRWIQRRKAGAARPA